MTDLEILLIIMLTAVTLAMLSYTIVDYIHTKNLEKLKRKKELHNIKEDIRKMQRDIIDLKIKGGS